MDKRNPYEEDVRLPLLIRPPAAFGGAGTTDSHLVNAVDLAPTILGLAGLTSDGMDGRSWLPLLDSRVETPQDWRSDTLIEYYGEAFGPCKSQASPASATSESDRRWSADGVNPGVFTHPPLFTGQGFSGYMVDETNNTWSCLRTLSPGEDSLFCQFWKTWDDANATSGAKPYFVEHYDVASDPWQLNNSAAALGQQERSRLERRLGALRRCKGAAECSRPSG